MALLEHKLAQAMFHYNLVLVAIRTRSRREGATEGPQKRKTLVDECEGDECSLVLLAGSSYYL